MKKVLVIDDSEDVRSLICDMLSSHGFEMLAEADGQAGVTTARQCLPDLVICDVHMPVLDGFGALARLREHPVTATIPFIFLSGMGDKPDLRRGMERGADDYLTKPFVLQELLGAVRTQLDKKQAVTHFTEKKLEELRGNISTALPHELLTPIAGILGFSSILIEDHASLPGAEVAEAARNIHQSALRLRRTIENFLLYTQIELAAADPARVAAVRKGDHHHAADVFKTLAVQVARQHERETDLHLEVESGVVAMAPDKLEKITSELLENAFKFSQPNTEVRFTARALGDSFVIAAEDGGRGFTLEQIRSIGAHMQFERRFYEQQGAGFGLVIIKRLAELHGGNLDIHSTPGVGTRVQVVLPTAA